MIMTKALLWFVALLVAALGAVAATEVPVSGLLIMIAAYMMTPLSPLPKWSALLAARYEGTSMHFAMKACAYLLPVVLLGVGFTGIGQHTTTPDSTPTSTQTTSDAATPHQQ